MSRRFLFVVDAPDDLLGGMSRHFRFVGREIERQGHAVDYIFIDQMPPPLVPRLRGFSLDICRRAYSAVTRYLKTHERPDLIYWGINSAFPFSTVNRLRAATRIPVVGMTFGVEERWWPIVDADAGKPGAPALPAYQHVTKTIRMQALKWATVHADRMVCVSSQDRRHLIERHGLDPSRVTMIPVGVAPRFFDAPASGRDGTRILFVGTWIWRKGIRYLVDAMQAVWKSRPECRLTIVTFPPFEDVRRWWPADCVDRLRIVPARDDDDLAREYASHDVFVLPSLFEGMPMSIAEAMATGMAVVTTETCGMRDLIHHGTDGILVPTHDARALADAIVGLLDDPRRRCALGEAAVRTASACTWSRIADRYLDVFRDAMSQ
jgi:glycosyltransferase involved in cell wall biosynthesis